MNPMSDIEYLIVGLGNPGPEYTETRHNVGFMTIDGLGNTHGANYWKNEAGAQTCPVSIHDKRVLLVKPQTFMNLSGTSVARLAKEYEIDPSRIIIIHDDLDIEEGELRHKTEGGHAGHNGLRSIHAKLGTDGYRRIRCGIGRPPGRMDSSDFVLQPLKGEKLDNLYVTAANAADMVEELLR
jgi:PTH1 family peptidyl-tRNA hydrolase